MAEKEPSGGFVRHRGMRMRIPNRVPVQALVAVSAFSLVLAACASPNDSLDSSSIESTTTAAPSTTSTTVAIPTTTDPPEVVSATRNAGDLRAIILADAEGRLPDDTMIEARCGAHFPVSALESVPLLAESGLAEVEKAIRPFLESEEGGHWPQDGWRILHRTDSQVTLVHLDGTAVEPTVALMYVENDADEWRWAGSSIGGECPLEVMVPAGLNAVDWRLDPSAEPPTSDSTAIHVLVTERACASGQAVGERLLGPQVIVTDTEIQIAFAAQALGGIQTCPGNPETAVTVELSGAIGPRVVANGLALDISLEDLLQG